MNVRQWSHTRGMGIHMIRFILILAALAATTACVATPPGVYSFEPAATIERPREEIWTALIDLAASQGWPIEMLETESGFMSFGSIALDLSYVDCGTAPMAQDVGLPRANVNITVRGDDVRSMVRVNVINATQTRTVLGEIGEAPCNSRGTFETFVLNSLRIG